MNSRNKSNDAGLLNKNLILIGDFNVNFLDQVANTGTDFSNNEAKSTTNKLQSILSQFELSVVNKEPTRVTETSATLIDLVITNRPRWIKNSQVLDIGISDHKLVASTLSLKVTRPKPKIVETRNYKSFNEEKFRRDLQEAPWTVCQSLESADDACWAWRELYTEICKENAPLRKIKVRSQSLPWITGKLRHKMNLRYKLLKEAKRTGRQDVRQRYKTIRNEVTKELRRCKAEYYNDQFQKVKNTKSFWKLINKASNTRVDPPPPAIRRDDGTLATSDKEKAELLNSYFASIGENQAKKTTKTNRTHPNTLHKSYTNHCLDRYHSGDSEEIHRDTKPTESNWPRWDLPQIIEISWTISNCPFDCNI